MFSKFKERLKYFFFEVENDWEIGFTTSSPYELIEQKKVPKMKWFDMPKDVFWADPFGVKIKDNYYIFFEEFLKDKNYGIICCITLNSEFEVLSKKTIIDEGVHFSFPNVFIFNDDFYMLPETASKQTLSLYKAVKFPYKWREERTLLNEPCLDSILYFEDDQWHLLYSKIGDETKLFLRKSESLLTDWNIREEQLINSNPNNSRNGGQILKLNEWNYKISQNCTNRYGECITINKFKKSIHEACEDTIYHTISMTKNRVSCCHTLNVCGDIILLDRRRERLFFKTPAMIVRSFKQKLTVINEPNSNLIIKNAF
jgi:hypothetical protein